MGFLDAVLGKREPTVEYRTIDGGHPAPYPDMTDEQLYNYEIAFNVPNKTFDRPPRASAPAPEADVEPTAIRPRSTGRYSAPPRRDETREEPQIEQSDAAADREPDLEQEARQDTEYEPEHYATQHAVPAEPFGPPLDFSRPVRTITTKHPVEILTTRARHPVYKVHAYIGGDDVVTVFTLDGRLSPNGPRFLENIPSKQQLFLNVYPNPDTSSSDRYLLTQHETREEADALASERRVACVPVEFDL